MPWIILGKFDQMAGTPSWAANWDERGAAHGLPWKLLKKICILSLTNYLVDF
jgi:hypothetical protein